MKEENKEIEIIKSLQNKFDEHLFLLIYDIYSPMLKSIVGKVKKSNKVFTGSFDMLMHHATSGLYDAIMAYDASKGATLSTYIYVVVERKLYRIMNKSFGCYNNMHYSYDSNECEQVLAGNIREPEVEYNNEQIKKALNSVTQTLDPVTQKIMYYVFNSNYTYAEIGQRLNLTYKQVCYKITKAKDVYKRYLEEHKEIVISNIDL